MHFLDKFWSLRSNADPACLPRIPGYEVMKNATAVFKVRTGTRHQQPNTQKKQNMKSPANVQQLMSFAKQIVRKKDEFRKIVLTTVNTFKRLLLHQDSSKCRKVHNQIAAKSQITQTCMEC